MAAVLFTLEFGGNSRFGGDLGGWWWWWGGGGGGGGGGGADVQRQLDGVVRNKLIYQRIATALRVLSYTWEQCVLNMKNLVQKYKKVISMHDPYNYTRRQATCPFFSKVTFA